MTDFPEPFIRGARLVGKEIGSRHFEKVSAFGSLFNFLHLFTCSKGVRGHKIMVSAVTDHPLPLHGEIFTRGRIF
jgi:hypothetical protein